MSSFSQWIKQHFTKGSSLMQLLIINIGIYIIVQLLSIILTLFNIPASSWTDYLNLPANLWTLLHQPWTLITYMFMHVDFLHLFFNMICLYWFGQIFLNFFSQKQLVGVYVLGGLMGGIIFILAYNIFPYFAAHIASSYLLGASAAVMAIMVAIAFKAPNYPIRLFVIGEVKLVYIVIFMVLVSVLGVTSHNAGGEFSHLGGALLGYLFTLGQRKGKDITRPISAVLDWFSNLFKVHPGGKLKKTRIKVNREQKVKTDADYNQQKAANNRDVDAILDKIKRSGYSSLTAEEKQRLFDKSQNL